MRAGLRFQSVALVPRAVRRWGSTLLLDRAEHWGAIERGAVGEAEAGTADAWARRGLKEGGGQGG